ncbi:14092_t:CDS:2 [Dentiscutata erythropus]|uniref:14092_t:CDS:1 n=1 Tax=Dentiscutata erythropus TaxID=1348616 RepID=A0A9N9AU46_9GLOM|nr:14092_t:CDS:2 [Dentiscutata erythropus]
MDNTTTNKAVVQILQKELPNIDLISIRYMYHILNLIVNTGMMEINILWQKVHKIMKYLANSLANGRIELLKLYCKVVGINFLQPILEIETRWNSVLEMFERYIILHPAIKEMQLKKTSFPPCLEIDELLELELTCKILKPFAIQCYKFNKKKFQKYWSKISDYVLIAYILDPRYKMEHLKATILEIGGYSETKAEQYINNI